MKVLRTYPEQNFFMWLQFLPHVVKLWRCAESPASLMKKALVMCTSTINQQTSNQGRGHREGRMEEQEGFKEGRFQSSAVPCSRIRACSVFNELCGHSAFSTHLTAQSWPALPSAGSQFTNCMLMSGLVGLLWWWADKQCRALRWRLEERWWQQRSLRLLTMHNEFPRSTLICAEQEGCVSLSFI